MRSYICVWYTCSLLLNRRYLKTHHHLAYLTISKSYFSYDVITITCEAELMPRKSKTKAKAAHARNVARDACIGEHKHC